MGWYCPAGWGSGKCELRDAGRPGRACSPWHWAEGRAHLSSCEGGWAAGRKGISKAVIEGLQTVGCIARRAPRDRGEEKHGGQWLGVLMGSKGRAPAARPELDSQRSSPWRDGGSLIGAC